jgi:hypothetical protein
MRNFIAGNIHVYVIINFIGLMTLVCYLTISIDHWQTSERRSDIKVDIVLIIVQNEIMQPTTCKNYFGLGTLPIAWNSQQYSPLHL